jgi:ABC-type branched-subunit amino acid transport system substrate-binding protein
LKRSKVRVALLSSSVRTNSVVVAIAKENAKLPKNERLQLLGSMSFSHQDILSRGGAALEGTVISAPCIPYNSAYMKNAARRWEAKEVNWRVTTSYDATKSLIQAIHLSEEPSRQSILTQLRSLNLPAAESSGFGVVFSDSNHDNVKRNYCLFERRNFQLQEIIPIKKDPRD